MFASKVYSLMPVIIISQSQCPSNYYLTNNFTIFNSDCNLGNNLIFTAAHPVKLGNVVAITVVVWDVN